jgi:hypothetical protein
VNRERWSRDPFDERFTTLQHVQEALDRLGYQFYPIPKEHVEGGVTDPLVHRIRRQTKKRGFEKVAGNVVVTFSGYATDPREVFAVPEIRDYWRALDARVSELPALVAYLPQVGFNGPGLHMMLLGTVDDAIAHPEIGGYDVHVADAAPLIHDALRRIRAAGVAHRLKPTTTQRLLDQFVAGATHRLKPI